MVLIQYWFLRIEYKDFIAIPLKVIRECTDKTILPKKFMPIKNIHVDYYADKNFHADISLERLPIKNLSRYKPIKIFHAD